MWQRSRIRHRAKFLQQRVGLSAPLLWLFGMGVNHYLNGLASHSRDFKQNRNFLNYMMALGIAFSKKEERP